MENKVIETKNLALLFDGRKIQFGKLVEDKNLFVTLDNCGGYYYSSEMLNRGIIKGETQVLTLDKLYSKSEPINNKQKLRNTLDNLEDATLFCVYSKGTMELKDIRKVEVFLTKSIVSRFMHEEAQTMFDESILPMFEESVAE